MATYTITIANKSAYPQTYRLFAEVPVVTDNHGEVFSNVYAVGRPTHNDGSIQQFAIPTKAFAVCGYKKVLDRAVISGDDNIEVNLQGDGPDMVTMPVDSGSPYFTDDVAGGPAGSFVIDVKPYDASLFPDVFCGYGKLAAAGDHSAGSASASEVRRPGVKLVACWNAKPTNTYTVTPVIKYYICTGDFSSGEAVRVTEVGVKQTIDFTGLKESYAYFEQLSDGTYTDVKYSLSPPAAAFHDGFAQPTA